MIIGKISVFITKQSTKHKTLEQLIFFPEENQGHMQNSSESELTQQNLI